ncbi:hypothetical protein PRNP1_012221 [Phytophthora ramorum]
MSPFLIKRYRPPLQGQDKHDLQRPKRSAELESARSTAARTTSSTRGCAFGTGAARNAQLKAVDQVPSMRACAGNTVAG